MQFAINGRRYLVHVLDLIFITSLLTKKTVNIHHLQGMADETRLLREQFRHTRKKMHAQSQAAKVEGCQWQEKSSMSRVWGVAVHVYPDNSCSELG
jgi:hypothetical protein